MCGKPGIGKTTWFVKIGIGDCVVKPVLVKLHGLLKQVQVMCGKPGIGQTTWFVKIGIGDVW